LEQVLANESSVHVLSALLDQRVPLTLTADLLYKWFECTFDKVCNILLTLAINFIVAQIGVATLSL
jgi:hypothetical protein